VYRGLDNAGVTRYYGVTRRAPNVRFNEHLRATGTGREMLDYEVIQGNLSRSEALRMEQMGINQFGMQRNGGQLLNQRNAIAPNRWIQFNLPSP